MAFLKCWGKDTDVSTNLPCGVVFVIIDGICEAPLPRCVQLMYTPFRREAFSGRPHGSSAEA